MSDTPEALYVAHLSDDRARPVVDKDPDEAARRLAERFDLESSARSISGWERRNKINELARWRINSSAFRGYASIHRVPAGEYE